jgi:hypothetical protein
MSKSAYDSQLTLPATRCDAIWVLMSNDTCATLTPNNAGNINRVTLRVPGWFHAATSPLQRRLMRGSKPSFFRAGICTPNCSAPPAITPTTMA